MQKKVARLCRLLKSGNLDPDQFRFLKIMWRHVDSRILQLVCGLSNDFNIGDTEMMITLLIFMEARKKEQVPEYLDVSFEYR